MSNYHIFLIIMTFFSFSCSSQESKNNEDQEIDKFYQDASGWDYIRIPLIKPYELTKLKREEWNMDLKSFTLQMSVDNIKGVNVIDSVIILHSQNGLLRGEEVQEAWFVILPSNQTERGFNNMEDFKSYLKSLNISNFSFYDPDKLFESYKVKWPIDWANDFESPISE